MEKSTQNFAQQLAQILSDDESMKKAKESIHTTLKRLKSLMASYQCALMEVETKFKVLNERFSLDYERNPIDMIKTRIKSPESIREKLIKKGLPVEASSLEKLDDIAGIRVICSFVDDIYMLADCLLKQDDIKLISKKDYIKSPKDNGYRSLHLIVEVPVFLESGKHFMRVEVQLRTIAMEFWANLEHRLRYKKNLSDEINLLTHKELLICAEQSAKLDERMQKIRDLIES